MPVELFSASIDTKQVAKDLGAVYRHVIPRAEVRTLNRVASTVRTRVVRGVSVQMGLAQKRIRPEVRVQKATFQFKESRVIGSGKPFKLSYFPKRQLKAGVKAKAWGQWTLYPGTFIATMPTGHVGVFRRVGKKRPRRRRTMRGKPVPLMVRPRLPIKELWGPRVLKEFERFLDAGFKAEIPTLMAREFEHQLSYYMSRALKRGRR